MKKTIYYNSSNKLYPQLSRNLTSRSGKRPILTSNSWRIPSGGSPGCSRAQFLPFGSTCSLRIVPPLSRGTGYPLASLTTRYSWAPYVPPASFIPSKVRFLMISLLTKRRSFAMVCAGKAGPTNVMTWLIRPLNYSSIYQLAGSYPSYKPTNIAG